MENWLIFPLSSILFFSFHHLSLVQSLIPPKYDGFPYGSGGELVLTKSIIIEAFFDPVCPDSRDAWPPLKKIIKDYYPRLSLIVHPFPLPYHDNSFIACRSLHIANMLNASATYPLLESFFKYQGRYYNAPTANLSRASIIADMAKFGAMAIGNSQLPAFQSAFKDRKTDRAARNSFNYGCSRGVTGTPSFFVNGFLLPDSGSAMEYKTWKSIIDPLLVTHKELHYFK